jgi:DNA-binding winged helix-turn-helix (wHTH) protein
MNEIAIPPFLLDVASRVPYRDGELEPIPLKSIEVLIALLERRGEVVTKAELLDRVWRDVVVE